MRVAVIGGGVVGLACAWELAREGAEVVEFEMHESGMVIAALSDDGLAPYRRLADVLRRLGYEGGVDELDGPAAAELEPALDGDRVARALHTRLDRYVRPEELTAGLASSLRRMGVTIHEGRRVDALEEVSADKVVVAAGLGSGG